MRLGGNGRAWPHSLCISHAENVICVLTSVEALGRFSAEGGRAPFLVQKLTVVAVQRVDYGGQALRGRSFRRLLAIAERAKVMVWSGVGLEKLLSGPIRSICWNRPGSL